MKTTTTPTMPLTLPSGVTVIAQADTPDVTWWLDLAGSGNTPELLAVAMPRQAIDALNAPIARVWDPQVLTAVVEGLRRL